MWLFIICAVLFIISVLIIAGDSLSKWVGQGDMVYDVLFGLGLAITILSFTVMMCCPLSNCDSAKDMQSECDIYYSYLMNAQDTNTAQYVEAVDKIAKWNMKVDRKMKKKNDSFTSWYVNDDWETARKYDLSKIRFIIIKI